VNQLNTIKNISWNAISTVITQGLQLLSVLVLARYLEPSDFGIFAIIFAIVGFLNMYADAGFSAYLIHKQGIEVPEVSAFFYLNLVIGITLTIITFFFSTFHFCFI
jgi:O-antigen/teichoic acid export membrane protein